MSRRLSVVLSFFVAISLAVTVVESAGEAEEPRSPQDKILWANKEKQRAMFIPQSLLQGPLSDLPVDESSLRGLKHRLKVQRHPELFPKELPFGRVAECRQESGSASPGSAANAMDLTTLLASSDVVWIGTIVDIEPGVEPRLVAAVEVAYVQLEEIFRLRPGASAPSSERSTAVMFGGAKVSVSGTVLCDEGAPGFYEPRVGDRILLGGSILTEDPRVFQGYVFPLKGNTIRLQPYSLLEPDSGPQQLDALRARLQEVVRE